MLELASTNTEPGIDAICIAFIHQNPCSLEEMKPEWKTIDIGGSSLSYMTVGEGPCLMLIHGFAEDHSIWDEQIPFLSEKFRCIIPDLFGSGKSGSLTETHIRSLDDIAKCLQSLLMQENIEKASIMGHSMGGYLSLAFADLFPELLEGFALIHSTSYPDDEEKKIMRTKIIRYWKSHGSRETQKNSVPGLFAEENRQLPGVKKQIEIAENINTENMIAYYRFMIERPDRTRVLKEIKVPVLIVAGKWDPAVPYTHSIKQSILPENAEIHVLKQSGHMGMIEESARINQILRNFMMRIHK